MKLYKYIGVYSANDHGSYDLVAIMLPEKVPMTFNCGLWLQARMLSIKQGIAVGKNELEFVDTVIASEKDKPNATGFSMEASTNPVLDNISKLTIGEPTDAKE